jgi:hypothetical protein
MLIGMLALSSNALAVEDPSKFEAYKQRLASRHAYALQTRRTYNAAKGPHVYRTAIDGSSLTRPFIAIEQGWVRQPPIPLIVRPVVGITYDDPYGYYTRVRSYRGGGRAISIVRN